jgi:hypothetical protein
VPIFISSGAAQVVTKDSQTGFTVYADVAAAKELVNLVKGARLNQGPDSNYKWREFKGSRQVQKGGPYHHFGRNLVLLIH